MENGEEGGSNGIYSNGTRDTERMNNKSNGEEEKKEKQEEEEEEEEEE